MSRNAHATGEATAIARRRWPAALTATIVAAALLSPGVTARTPLPPALDMTQVVDMMLVAKYTPISPTDTARTIHGGGLPRHRRSR